MIIQITHTEKNATPTVIEALENLKANGGGELHFKNGEYHFYREATRKEFFAVSNNSACDKHIVFPILDMENLIIDGHNSIFVFHDIVFPFMVSQSKKIIIRNINLDTSHTPLVKFNIHDKTDDGVYMDIDRDISPFFIENNNLYFQRECEIISSKNELFSLHALDHHKVQYFAIGDCNVDMSNLPASLIKCDVCETPTGIYARYRSDTPSYCCFDETVVGSIIDGGKRKVDVICLDRSEKIELCNITVRRGIGMGIVAQLSRNILINGFSTDAKFHSDDCMTLTADAMHFINCDGTLEIKNCTISDTMDDVLNIHGMYTEVVTADTDTIYSSIKHYEQYYFNPYRPGDRLEIIDNTTFDVVAEFHVEDAYFKDTDGKNIIIKGHFSYGFDKIQKGFLIENPDRMPDVHLHDNYFFNFPHIRISGGGEILIEENRFCNCNAALLCLDLAKYWYESGRVNHLVYRNNFLDNCNGRGGKSFLRIGIDGVPDDIAPKIHKKVEIIGNHFSKIKRYAISASGVKELIVKDNTFDVENENFFDI
ncbi:MAG: hypothetical protein IKD04_08935 [Clostridia bacterium]|nr:hypothetical protein [Clostridia bacterium]